MNRIAGLLYTILRRSFPGIRDNNGAQMRLLDPERKAIMEAISRFDNQAEAYLFGSRSDDAKKGGDIDILIISDKLDKHSLFSIEEEIFKKIEEQKIDFVLSGKDLKNKFARMILKKGAIKLWL